MITLYHNPQKQMENYSFTGAKSATTRTQFHCSVVTSLLPSLSRTSSPRVLQQACMLSCFSQVRLFVILWTVARQALLYMGFAFLGDLPDQGTESMSLAPPALAGGLFTSSSTWEAPCAAGGEPNEHISLLTHMQ